MKTKERFINHYKEGFMPWVHSKPDFNLVDMVSNWPVKPCKALEVGCGTGTDAVWLAEKGFEVTAADISGIPIEMARKSAEKSGVLVNFIVQDILEEKIPGYPFDFVFDRGFFHSFKSYKTRKRLAKKIAKHLTGNGLWLILAGSCDSPPREGGPPMRSARNIARAVEPFFEILLLKKSVFGSESEVPATIWVCLLKKR